jgi:hypothetical protein
VGHDEWETPPGYGDADRMAVIEGHNVTGQPNGGIGRFGRQDVGDVAASARLAMKTMMAQVRLAARDDSRVQTREGPE